MKNAKEMPVENSHCLLCGGTMEIGTGPWGVVQEGGEVRGMKHMFCSKKTIRRDPESVIQEYGAVKLSESAEGRKVLENARAKYRAELIQPHEPEFNSYWGKEVRKREKDMAELRAESQRQKQEKGMV